MRCYEGKKVNEWFRKFGELKEKSCVILKEDLFSALVSGVYETLTDIFHLHLNAEHEHLEYICRTFEVSKAKTFGAVTELFDFKEREGISDDFEAGQRLFDCIYKDYETSMLLLSKAFLKKTESAEFEKRKKPAKQAASSAGKCLSN